MIGSVDISTNKTHRALNNKECSCNCYKCTTKADMMKPMDLRMDQGAAPETLHHCKKDTVSLANTSTDEEAAAPFFSLNRIPRPSVFAIRKTTAGVLISIALYLAGTVIKNNLPNAGVCPTTVISHPKTALNLNFMKAGLSGLPIAVFWLSLAGLGTFLAYWTRRKSNDTKAVFFILGASAAGWATSLSYATSLVDVDHGHLVHFNLGVLLAIAALLGLINLARDLYPTVAGHSGAKK